MTQVTISTDAQRAYRNRLVLTTALCGTLLIAAPAYGQVVSSTAFNGLYTGFGSITATHGTGAGGVTRVDLSGSSLNIEANASGIIDWSDFNIAGGATANFSRVGGTSPINILNRIASTGGKTTIDGKLTSGDNVGVYIINPNGIIFGSNARVNVGSLVTSTLNVSNNDFLLDEEGVGASDGTRKLRFTDLTNKNGIEVKPGAKINVSGSSQLGNILFVGSSIDVKGALNSQDQVDSNWNVISANANTGNEVVLVTASDVTVSLGAVNPDASYPTGYNPDAPIRLVLHKGTTLAGSQIAVADGALVKGRSVTIAMASAQGFTDALLSIGGTITSDTVQATDRGIMLIAGNNSRDVQVSSVPPPSQRPGAVAYQTGSNDDLPNFGRIGLQITSTANIAAAGIAGNVEIQGDDVEITTNPFILNALPTASKSLTIGLRAGNIDLTGFNLAPSGGGNTSYFTDINLDTGRGNIKFNSIRASGNVGLVARGSTAKIDFQDIEANRVIISAVQAAVTGNSVKGRNNVVNLAYNRLSLNSAESAGELTLGGAYTTVGTLKSTASNVILQGTNSNGHFTVTGDVDAANGIWIKALGALNLGVDADAETIKAGRNLVIESYGSGITGGAGLKLQGAATYSDGDIYLFTNGGINFDPTSLIRSGIDNGVARDFRIFTSDQAASQAANWIFGDVSARAFMVAVDPRVNNGYIFTNTGYPPLPETNLALNPFYIAPTNNVVRTGSVTFDTLNLTQGLSLQSTGGGITFGTVNITQGGLTSSAALGLTLNGDIVARDLVDLSATGLFSAPLRNITSQTGNVLLTGTGVNVGNLSGARIKVDGKGGGVTTGALNGGSGGIEIDASDAVQINGIAKAIGTIDITGGSITAANRIDSGANVVLDTTGLTLSTGAVSVTNNDVSDTDAIKAGGSVTVKSRGAATVQGGNITATTGAVQINADGQITVRNVTAGGGAVIDGTIRLDSNSGGVSAENLTATSAGANLYVESSASSQNIGLGQLLIGDDIYVASGGGNLTITGTVTSNNGGVSLASLGVLNAGTITAGGGTNSGWFNRETIYISAGQTTVGNVTAQSGNIYAYGTNSVTLGQARALSGIAVSSTGAITLGAAQNIVNGATAASGDIRINSSGGTITANGIIDNGGSGRVFMRAAGLIDAQGISASGAEVSGSETDNAITDNAATIDIRSAGLNATTITATSGDIDVDAAGAVTASGNIGASGDITIATNGIVNLQGVSTTGTGLIDIAGNGLTVANVSTGAASGGSVRLAGGTGALTLNDSVTGRSDVTLLGASIGKGGAATAGVVTSGSGAVTATAGGALTLTSVKAATTIGLSAGGALLIDAATGNVLDAVGNISVTTTGAGNITLGQGGTGAVNSTSGEVLLNAAGNVQVGTVTAGAAADADPNAATIDINATGMVTTGALTANNGDIEVDGVGVTLGKVTGNGGTVDLDAKTGALRLNDSVTGLGTVTLAGASIAKGPAPTANAGNITSTGGGIRATVTTGNITLGNLDAEQGVDIDDLDAASSDFTIGNITARGAAGDLSNATVDIDTKGYVQTGSITALNGTIDIDSGKANGGNSLYTLGLRAGRGISLASTAAGRVYLDSAESVAGGIDIVSGGDVLVGSNVVGGTLINRGSGNISVTAKGAGTIKTFGLIQNDGGLVTLAAPGAITVAGDITAGGAVDPAANAGTITIKGATVSAGNVLAQQGGVPTGDIYIRATAVDANGNGIAVKSLKAGGSIDALTTAGGIYIGDTATSTPGNVTSTNDFVHLTAPGRIIAADVTAGGAVDAALNAGTITLVSSGSYVAVGDVRAVNGSGTPTGDIYIRSAGTGGESSWDNGIIAKSLTAGGGIVAEATVVGGIYIGTNPGNPNSSTAGNVNNGTGEARLSALGTSGNIVAKDIFSDGTIDLGNGNGAIKVGILDGDQGVLASAGLEVTIQSAISSAGFIDVGSSSRAVTVENSAGAQYAMNGYQGISLVGGSVDVKQGGINSAAGTVTVEATSGNVNVKDVSAAINASLTATGNVTAGNVRADGVVPSINATVTISADDTIQTGNITANNGDIYLSSVGQAGTDSIKTGALTGAAGIVAQAVNGNIHITSAETEAGGTISLIAGLGNLTVDGLVDSGSDVTLYAWDTVDLQGAVTAVGDVTVTGGANLFDSTGQAVKFTSISGRDVTVEANNGTIKGATLTATREATVNSYETDIDSTSRILVDIGSVNGAKTSVTSSNGDIALGSVTANYAVVTSADGNLDIGTVSQTGNYGINSGVELTGANVDVDAITQSTRAEITATAGNINFGSISGSDITLTAGSGSVLGMAGTGGDITQSGIYNGRARVTVIGGTVNIDDIGFTGSSVEITSTAGDVTVGDITGVAGSGFVTVKSSDANSIAVGDVTVGDITAGGKLSLTGLSVTAGDLSGDSMEVTAESGSVTAGKTNSLGGNTTTSIIASGNITLNGDANAAFRITANAGGDITFGTISARDVQVTAGDEVSGQAVTAVDQAYIQGTNSVRLTSTGGGRIGLESNAAIQVGDFSGARLYAVAHGGTIDLASVNQTGSVTLGGQTYSGVYIHNEADMSAAADAAYVRIGTLNADNTTTIIGPRITATGGNWTVWDSRPGAPTQPTLHLSALDTVSLRNVKAGTISLDSVVTDANDPDTQYNNYTAMYNQAAGTAIEADLVTGQAASIDWSQGNRIGRIANLLTYSNLTINDTTGGISLGGAINAVGGDIDIRTRGGNLAIEAGATVSGRLVALSTQGANGTAGYFVNNAGSNAVQASGHWAIYADYYQNPGDFGGLDSNKTAIWNNTIDTLAPSGTGGNRYIFSHTPTVTITANDYTKTYGNVVDVNGIGYRVEGIEKAVAGAFLGDDVNAVIGTNITLSSLGGGMRANATERNDGTFGPAYAITVQGAQANLGYALETRNGNLNVAKRRVTATATVDSQKTYDGNANANGSYAFNDALAEADFDITSAFEYTDSRPGKSGKDVDKDAVTGAINSKRVIHTRRDLVDPNSYADNYVISYDDQNLTSRINPLDISVTISAQNKVYDGTTAAVGQATAVGMLSGDVLEVVGGRFEFENANASDSAKRVIVTGTPELAGADKDNYNVVATDVSTTAYISRAPLTVSVAANGKTYDGTTNGNGGTASITSQLFGSDQLSLTGGVYTFLDPNAGNQQVRVTGLELVGDDVTKGNYYIDYGAAGAIMTSALISKAKLSLAAIAGQKTYNGARDANVTYTLQGQIFSQGGVTDDVRFDSAVAEYANADAGTDKDISIHDISLVGSDARNYEIDDFSIKGAIDKRVLSVSISADNKDYDRTTNAVGRISIGNVVQGDVVNVTVGSYTFSTADAGQNKEVTANNISIDNNNYEIRGPVKTLAEIRKKLVDVVIAANSRDYNGNTSAQGRITGVNGVIDGDVVGATGGAYAFSDKNADSGKTVTGTGFELTGAAKDNYAIRGPATTTADILKKVVQVTVAANGKTYDGTVTTTGRATTNDFVAGDAVSLTGGTYTFSDANAGTGKQVTVSGVSMTGNDARNYTLVVPTMAFADIMKRAITVRANDLFKVVDKPDPELTYRVVNGTLVAGDSFTGALSRTPGEALGTYAIGQGTLALSSNYALTFQGGTFRIGQEGDDPGIPTNVNGGLNNDIQQTVEMGNGSGLENRRPPLVWEGYIDCTSDDLRDREGCKIDSSHLDGFVEASVELGIEAPAV